MYYTKHITLTNNTLTTLFTIPNGYVVYVNYVFVANHGGSTNSVDLTASACFLPNYST